MIYQEALYWLQIIWTIFFFFWFLFYVALNIFRCWHSSHPQSHVVCSICHGEIVGWEMSYISIQVKWGKQMLVLRGSEMAIWKSQPLSLSFPQISLKEKCTGVHLGRLDVTSGNLNWHNFPFPSSTPSSPAQELGCGGLGDGPAPSLLGVCFLKGARTPLVPVETMFDTRPYLGGHTALEKG